MPDKAAHGPEESSGEDQSRRRIIGISAFLVFAAGLALVAWISAGAPSDDQAETISSIPVTTFEAIHHDGYTVERSFVGRVEARRESSVGFELAGRVARVAVDEGDTVASGAVLAVLDTDRLRARHAAVAAQRDQATSQARLAEVTRGRVVEAKALDAVSSQALDEAELGLATRQAELKSAEASLEQIDVELAKSKLRAPYDALVVSRAVDEGQVVASGSPVLHLLERQRPRARIGVTGDASRDLSLGSVLDVEIDDQRLRGTVQAILPMRQRGTRTVDVIIELDAWLDGGSNPTDGPEGPAVAVRSGDLARLHMERRLETSGFWLPMSALTESSRGLWAAFVLNADGVLERRELEMLHEEADEVFVRGTLQHGERVVRTGLHRLVPGLPAHAVESSIPEETTP